MSILEKYKKLIMIGTGCVAIGAVAVIIYFSIRKNAFVVSVEGKVLGIVQTKENAQSVYDEVVKEIDEKVNVPFKVNEVLEIEAVHASKKEITSHETLLAAIQEAVSYEVEAYEIFVEDVSYGVVSSKEEATRIFESLGAKYAPHNGTVKLEVAEKEEQEVAKEETNELANDIGDAFAVEEETENVLVTNDTSSEHVEDVTEVSISGVEADKKEVEKTKTDENAQDIQKVLQSYDFNEAIMIKSCFIEEEKILTEEEAKQVLSGKNYELVEYELVEGDNIWDIAVAFDTTEKRILELNPEVEDATKMQIGQKIKVEKSVPILSITTIEESTFKELIPGEIQYKPSKHFVEGYSKVIVEGNDGVKELTVEVTKVNGEEVSRQTLSEKVLKEANVTVIAYGIKKKEEVEVSSSNNNNNNNNNSSNNSNNSNSSNNSSSNNSSNSGNQSSSSSSGQYIHPLKGAGVISSGYGTRWGTFHYGLDFAAPAGTPIYASRSGKVIYSGYNNGGYGKLIILEHSDGSQTYYAHCSSLYVQVGESVSQGEKIAGVGTTGDSTGNHLHFEIRKNGKPVNPANYL